MLHGLSTKVQTEVFVTDKDKVERIPTTTKNKENRPKTANTRKVAGQVSPSKTISPKKETTIA